jgi:hypothetical protein
VETEQSAFVEVIEYTVYLPVAGKDGQLATLGYTVRPADGDVLTEAPGVIGIQYAARDVVVGGEKKRLAGKKVTLQTAHFVGVEREVRYEPRERPSMKLIADRDKAQVEALKKKLGVE